MGEGAENDVWEIDRCGTGFGSRLKLSSETTDFLVSIDYKTSKRSFLMKIEIVPIPRPGTNPDPIFLHTKDLLRLLLLGLHVQFLNLLGRFLAINTPVVQRSVLSKPFFVLGRGAQQVVDDKDAAVDAVVSLCCGKESDRSSKLLKKLHKLTEIRMMESMKRRVW